MPGYKRLPMMVILVGTVLLVGCAGKGLIEVKGTVTYAGQPIPSGVVWLDPDGGAGAQGYAFVKDGQFSTAAKGGKGIKPGPYTIRIEGYNGVATEAHPMGLPLFPDYTEKRHISESVELTITVPDKKSKT